MFFLSPALHDIFHTPIYSLFMLKLSLNTHQPSNHLFVLVTKFGTKVEHGGRSLNAVRPLGFHPQSRETLVVWYLCTYHLTHSRQILHDNSYSGEGTWNVFRGQHLHPRTGSGSLDSHRTLLPSFRSFISRIVQKLFHQSLQNLVEGWKNPLDFDGNPDNITLGLG